MTSYVGPMTASAVGIVLKELVRRMFETASKSRLEFEVQQKVGYDGRMGDVFTQVDKAVQAVGFKGLNESFPGVPILGEEDFAVGTVQIPRSSYYFTIDPIDGTKAFIRKQSHGISVMLALVHHDRDGEREVISAWIGDINTREIYGYRPESDKTHRIRWAESAELLSPNPKYDRETKYALLRSEFDKHSKAARALIGASFDGHDIEGGSIGCTFARLWKEEVAGILLRPAYETPWDSTPVIGISKHLGYVFLRQDMRESKITWEQFEPELVEKPTRRDHEMLIVHANYLPHLKS